MKHFDVCIYHHPCADGFGAAWVVRKALGDIEFVPGQYQLEASLPDVAGKRVLLVDFSYKRHDLIHMAEAAESIVVLDHHKSAMDDLTSDDWPDNLELNFDMYRSGAMMAWDYFFPKQPAPRLIQHIQDRDLWRFNMPGTKEIQAALFSYPYDFDVWDDIMHRPEDLLEEGVAINRKHMKDIHELLAMCTRRLIIAGYNVPAVNLPYTMSSEAGHIMSQGEPFAACYYDTQSIRNFSLRSSNKGGIDVSRVAALYGGGGHKHAAGFRVSFEGAKEFEM